VLVVCSMPRRGRRARGEEVLEQLAQPFRLNGQDVKITGSVGIALSPQDGDEQELLLRSADGAMYRAKALGKNGFQFCDPGLAPLLAGRLALGDRLHDAFARREIELVYQPELDVASGRIVGVEALLRWNDPTRGAIPPGEFIPLAEQTGLIVALGDWTLQQACVGARSLMLKWPGLLRLSVNLSLRQLRERDFVARVKAAVDDAGLTPAARARAERGGGDAEPRAGRAGAPGAGRPRLRTEPRRFRRRLLGSSASSRRSRCGGSRIDRSWIAAWAACRATRAVVQGIIGLARSLGLAGAPRASRRRSSARGRAARCDAMQGGLFGARCPPTGSTRCWRGEALARGKLSGRLRFL